MKELVPALLKSLTESLRGLLPVNSEAKQDYADGLRYTVALSVGVAILIGLLCIIRGWPIQYLIIGGYIGVVIMTASAPEEIIGIAYDSSGVTTSTATVPLVTALGLGLSSNIPGRNPMLDSFGLIAFTCIFPIMTLMAYAQIIEWYLKRSKAKHE